MDYVEQVDILRADSPLCLADPPCQQARTFHHRLFRGYETFHKRQLRVHKAWGWLVVSPSVAASEFTRSFTHHFAEFRSPQVLHQTRFLKTEEVVGALQFYESLVDAH